MTNINPEVLEDPEDTLVVFDKTIRAVRGFRFMLSHTVESSKGILPEVGDVADVLDRQIEDLQDLHDTLETQIKELRESKLSVLSLRSIAEHADLTYRQAERAVSHATGIDLSEQLAALEKEAGIRPAMSALDIFPLLGLRENFARMVNQMNVPGDKLRQFFAHYLNQNDAFERIARVLETDVKTVRAVLVLTALPEMADKFEMDMPTHEAQQYSDRRMKDIRGDFIRLQQEFVADKVAAGGTPKEIGDAMLLTADTIARMILAMPDRETREAIDQRDGRTVFRIGAVADKAEIAQSLNLKQATVERVIDKLLGKSSPPQDAGDVVGKAVNE